MKSFMSLTINRTNVIRVVAAIVIAISTGFASPRVNAQGIKSTYYFDNGPIPALYVFRSDHTGVRTTYPTGTLSFGTSYPFAWSQKGNQMLLQFASGHTDLIQITGYDARTDTIHRIAPGYGDGLWLGCRSGRMPSIIAYQVCN